MNVKEKALSDSIKEYSNSVARYYTTLEGIMNSIEKLDLLEKQMEANYDKIMNFEGSVRPLNFVRDINNMPAIKEVILSKVKSFLKDE